MSHLARGPMPSMGIDSKANGLHGQSGPHPNPLPEGEGVRSLSLWERVGVRAVPSGSATSTYTSSRCALIMAGGTGGHIFPGLAVAQALRARGWRVHWLGTRSGMENQIAQSHGFAFEAINFSGLRGKGALALALLPLRLLRAFWQSVSVIRRIRPDVLVGLGGYISFPGGMMGALLGKPLVLHEQNAVAGLANKVLAGVADRVFTAFPQVMKKAQWVGNPLREAFLSQREPAARFAGRSGPLRLLVLGGSLGAQALNECVPLALAQIPEHERPLVTHQSGAKLIEPLRQRYADLGIAAELTPFIDDTAQALAQADVVVCRAGASTVTEIAAVGVAAFFVPLPSAVDDHQSANARFLVDAGAAWLLPQASLTPTLLAQTLSSLQRPALLECATRARALAQTGATAALVQACEELCV